MALGCRLPSGTVVNTEDLPLVVWEGIAIAGGLPVREWVNVAVSPAAYPKAAVELVAVCARHVREDVPPDGYLTLGNLLTVFFTSDDELPDETVADIPDPKAEGGPSMT